MLFLPITVASPWLYSQKKSTVKLQCYSALSKKERIGMKTVLHTASHFDIRMEPWRMNTGKKHAEESRQLGNLKLGHGTKHLIKAPICNCSILFLLFLYCLCVCSDSLNCRGFLIYKLPGELLKEQMRVNESVTILKPFGGHDICC